MLLTASQKRFYDYFNRTQALSDLNKRIFSNNSYFGSRAYYRAVLNQYVNLNSYLSIYEYSTDLNSLPTYIDIQPNMLGVTTKNIISSHGNPTFVFNENKLTIFVYKWKVNGSKTRCEVHFYNDKAFLVNYNYNRLSFSEKEYILKTFSEKYLDQIVTDPDIRAFKIIDKNDNLFYINDWLEGFKINYLCSKKSDWYENMTADIEAKKDKVTAKIRLAEKRFFNMI